MTQREAASSGRRVLACAMDVTIPLAVAAAVTTAMLLSHLPHARIVAVAIPVVWLVIHSVMQGGDGSLGMRVMRIRLIGADDLRAIGWGRALLRNVIFILLCTVLVGFITPLFDRTSRQGWHDRIAAAIMVQHGLRTPVVPSVLQEEKRAGEWLAGVSIGGATPEPITDVPVSRMSRYLTTAPPERADDVIDTVPGITDDRIRAERARVLNARRARGARLSALAPVQAARAERSPRTDEPPAITRPPAPPLTITQRSARAARPAIVVSPPVRPAGRTSRAETATQADTASVVRPVSVDRPASSVAGPAGAVHSASSLEGPSGAEAAATERLRESGAFVTIMWDDGTFCEIERATVFGRNPSGASDDELAVVFDDSLSLSKSHFRVLQDGQGIGLVDLHSTNGVRVRREGVTTPVVPGEFTRLQTGDLLEIGSRRARVEVM